MTEDCSICRFFILLIDLDSQMFLIFQKVSQTLAFLLLMSDSDDSISEIFETGDYLGRLRA